MCDNNNPSTQSIADYLAQLLKDRKQLAAFPNVFLHVERLLDEEISKVRASLFQINGVRKDPLVLPEPEGLITTLTEKVYVPVKEHPDFNFVGRILGPRGMTAKQLEQETGCKIMVRGKGSMRDKKKEDANRGKPNWEHLADELHVLLTVEDTENRAKAKLARAVDEVKRLLIPQADGEDELKKRQLMELAIINGTYRDSSTKSAVPTGEAEQACATGTTFSVGVGRLDGNSIIPLLTNYPRIFDTTESVTEEEWRRVAAAAETQRLLGAGGALAALRPQATGAPLGAPLLLSPRPPAPAHPAHPAPPHPAASLPLDHQLIYAASPYADYAGYAALAAAGNPLLSAEYAAADHTVAGGRVTASRRHLAQVRDHPYQRTGALS